VIIAKKPDKKSGINDPLLAPLEVRFKGEPAIDEGGVRKEFFHLIIT